MTVREALEGLLAAWRSGDALRAAAYFGPDAIYREARGNTVVGRERLTEHFTRFFRDGPAWRFEVNEVIVEGERAAVGYHFGVLQADGRWHERPGCALVAFDGGLINEWREYEG
jgi:uncharacterized protein (TIGR02246 family)